jgi:hypothetical protein
MEVKMKKLKGLAILLTFLLVFAACSTTEVEQPNELSYEGSLKIAGLDSDIEVSYNDIYSMESITEEFLGISSSGEESKNTYTGVKLNDVLALYGAGQSDFSFIRLTASDGYAIDVPHEIISQKDIVLAYEINGEVMEERSLPLRAVIDGERSMYYVSKLAEITLVSGNLDVSSEFEKIVILEVAANTLTLEDYTYYESVDKAIRGSELLEKFSNQETESVHFMAYDDFEKTEMLNVINQGYIKMTGENSPLFLAPELPKGMHTKNILTMDSGDVVFLSMHSAHEYFEESQIGEFVGISFENILRLLNISSEMYTLEAADGFQVDIPQSDLVQTIISESNGSFRVRAPEGMPNNYNLKDLMVIYPQDPVRESQGSTDVVDGEGLTANWEIQVDGLVDGSFTFTSDRAKSRLDLVELNTSVVRNDETLEEAWQGYRVLDVLSFLKVEDFDSIVFESGDGFKLELPASEINENSILAVVRNGEEMTDLDNLIRLVLDTPVSSNWIKGVVRLTVK